LAFVKSSNLKARKLANLEEISRRYEAAGLYTHVYASCGFLNESKPRFKWSKLPDGRSVFDLASLTKALVTTPLAILSCDEIKKDPHEASVLQAFGDGTVNRPGFDLFVDTKVSTLLRHESGLPAWRNFYVECEGKRQSLADILLRARPSPDRGSLSDVYSDVGFIFLGQLIESQRQKKLIDIWFDYCKELGILARPVLGLGSAFASENLISTGFCPVRGRNLLGDVHDENCWALGGFAGHAGLFGTGEGIEEFLHGLWRSPRGRRVFTLNFSEASSSGESLMGWRKGRDESARTFAEGRGCGHMGFTGTAFWVDPKTEAYAIVLTNRVISGRISSLMKSFRSEAFGALWEKLKTC